MFVISAGEIPAALPHIHRSVISSGVLLIDASTNHNLISSEDLSTLNNPITIFVEDYIPVRDMIKNNNVTYSLTKFLSELNDVGEVCISGGIRAKEVSPVREESDE